MTRDVMRLYGVEIGVGIHERIADAKAFLAGRPLDSSRQDMARKWLSDIFETEVVRAVLPQPTPRCVDCWQPDEDTDMNGRCYSCARELAGEIAADHAREDAKERAAEAADDARRSSPGGFR